MKPSRLATSLVFISIVSLGATTCSRRSLVPLTDILTRIDLHLVAGSLGEASRGIQDASKVAASRNDRMRLAKRSLSISSTGGDWSQLYGIADDALRAYPGVEEFAAIASYAAMKRGHLNRALAISREYLESDRFRSLYNEVWLRAGNADESSDSFSPDYSANLSTSDALAFEETGGRLNHVGLMLDAALIYAGIGDIDRAYEMVEVFSPQYPEPAAYLHYDAGDFDAAANILAKLHLGRPQDRLVLADSYLLAGRTDEYVVIAEEIISQFSDLSPTPFRNLTRIYRDARLESQAHSVVAAGLVQFPDDFGLITERVRLENDFAGYSQAIDLLDAFLAEFGITYDLALLELELLPSDGSYRRFESTLKTLFYRNPDDPRIARDAVAFFAANRRYLELGNILDAHLPEVEASHQIGFFRGVIAVYENDLEAAAAHFQLAAESAAIWQYRLDLALVLSALDRSDEAVEQLRRAFALTQDRTIQSRLSFEIGRVHAKSGEAESALRAVIYALELDPSLTEARLLARQLESAPQ